MKLSGLKRLAHRYLFVNLTQSAGKNRPGTGLTFYLCGPASGFGIYEQQAITTDGTVAVERAKKLIANDKLRGMKLLPQEIREKLPLLYSQKGKGGKAIVYLKFFTPSSSWTWYVTEGEPAKFNTERDIAKQNEGVVGDAGIEPATR